MRILLSTLNRRMERVEYPYAGIQNRTTKIPSCHRAARQIYRFGAGRLAAASIMMICLLLNGRIQARPSPPSSSHRIHPVLREDAEDDRPLVLIVDVDNTLYSETSLRKYTGRGIEQQIVENTHAYCHEHLDHMTPHQADDLFRVYGSTIEGLRATLRRTNNTTEQNDPTQQERQWMQDFYQQVYSPIDVSCLHQYHNEHAHFQDSTGYTHSAGDMHHDDDNDETKTVPTRIMPSDLLAWFRNLPCPVYLASNSPSWHVHKVLRALGLSNVPWADRKSVV